MFPGTFGQRHYSDRDRVSAVRNSDPEEFGEVASSVSTDDEIANVLARFETFRSHPGSKFRSGSQFGMEVGQTLQGLSQARVGIQVRIFFILQ